MHCRSLSCVSLSRHPKARSSAGLPHACWARSSVCSSSGRANQRRPDGHADRPEPEAWPPGQTGAAC